MTPAQSAGLEQRARELLAAEYKAAGRVYLGDALAIRAIVAALAAPAADGVLVPREPTPEMQHAYFDSIDKHLQRVQTDLRFGRFDNHRIAYKAMLAAAPQAQGEGDFVASAHIGNLTVFAKTAPRDESDKPEPEPQP